MSNDKTAEGLCLCLGTTKQENCPIHGDDVKKAIASRKMPEMTNMPSADEGRYLLWLKKKEAEGILEWIDTLRIMDIPSKDCFDGVLKLQNMLKEGPI